MTMCTMPRKADMSLPVVRSGRPRHVRFRTSLAHEHPVSLSLSQAPVHTGRRSREARERCVLSARSRASRLGAMIALAAGARSALAQDASVSGVVVAERSLRPVPGALVVADDSARRTTTDASGRFRIALPAGAPVSLTVRRLGYRPLR